MRVALVEPGSLVGKELRELIEASAERRFELQLYAAPGDAPGTLTRFDDEVALVAELTPQALHTVDVAVLCGSADEQRRALEMATAEELPVVVAATDLEHPAGALWVAGLGEPKAPRPDPVISPYPATIALSHLLAPLEPLGLASATATVLLPASSLDSAGLDELFGQVRSVLNFEAEKPLEVFGHQLAFNLLPGPSADAIRHQVAEILTHDPDLAVQLVQSPVFHGLAASLLVEVDAEHDDASLRRAFAESPYCEPFEPAQRLGPIDSTQQEEILVGRIAAAPGRPGSFWIWAVMDNLRRGGASNLLAILDDLAVQLATG